MSLNVQCPGCEKRLNVKEELAGKRVKCPGCGQALNVPGASAPVTKTRDNDGEDRPRRFRRDEDEDRRQGERPRQDEAGERPPRRPATVDDEEDEPRPKKKGRKKRRSFSVTEAIPLEYGVQIGTAALLGGGCCLGAWLAHVDVLYLPGVLACMWGCAALAKNNGRSELFGFLGLFGPIGFIFTAVLAKPKD